MHDRVELGEELLLLHRWIGREQGTGLRVELEQTVVERGRETRGVASQLLDRFGDESDLLGRHASGPRKSSASPSSERRVTPSLVNTRWRWLSTVRVAMKSRSPMSLLVNPDAASRATSSSRDDRPTETSATT